ncbi:hypothetical protein Dimus_003802, partial [Dionaea muscipula]
ETVLDFSLNDGVNPLLNDSNLEIEGTKEVGNQEGISQEEDQEHADEETGET